ncbi:pickpocket 15 [Cochliomyia hominivorax]
MFNKYEALPNLIEYVEELSSKDPNDYSYEIENFVSFLVYPYIYREGNIKSWCKPNSEYKCPTTGLRGLYHRFKTNCSDFFQYCEFSSKSFDCCKFFLPLITPHGNCFMLNSLLNNKRGSTTWFNNLVDPMTDIATLKIVTKMPTQISIMNEEDVPHDALPGSKIEANKAGQDKTFQIFMQTMINDPDVRDIAPSFRQCRFPDELLDDTAYRAYSFSTCFVDCLRVYQMKECNCSIFSVMPEDSFKHRDCDLDGIRCLEKLILVRPDGRNLLPWAKSKYTCSCLPSCTESDFKVVFDYQEKINKSNPYLTISVTMPEFATERYRRQALRTRLDVVVTIGGILGLFLGASILSGIEFLYYFTLRLWNNYRMEKRQKRQQQQQQQQQERKQLQQLQQKHQYNAFRN